MVVVAVETVVVVAVVVVGDLVVVKGVMFIVVVVAGDFVVSILVVTVVVLALSLTVDARVDFFWLSHSNPILDKASKSDLQLYVGAVVVT